DDWCWASPTLAYDDPAPTTEFVYTELGDYRPMLRVTDNNGETDTMKANRIYVRNIKPTIGIGGSQPQFIDTNRIHVGTPIIFDASASKDNQYELDHYSPTVTNNDGIVGYYWDVDINHDSNNDGNKYNDWDIYETASHNDGDFDGKVTFPGYTYINNVQANIIAKLTIIDYDHSAHGDGYDTLNFNVYLKDERPTATILSAMDSDSTESVTPINSNAGAASGEIRPPAPSDYLHAGEITFYANAGDPDALLYSDVTTCEWWVTYPYNPDNLTDKTVTTKMMQTNISYVESEAISFKSTYLSIGPHAIELRVTDSYLDYSYFVYFDVDTATPIATIDNVTDMNGIWDVLDDNSYVGVLDPADAVLNNIDIIGLSGALTTLASEPIYYVDVSGDGISIDDPVVLNNGADNTSFDSDDKILYANAIDVSGLYGNSLVVLSLRNTHYFDTNGDNEFTTDEPIIYDSQDGYSGIFVYDVDADPIVNRFVHTGYFTISATVGDFENEAIEYYWYVTYPYIPGSPEIRTETTIETGPIPYTGSDPITLPLDIDKVDKYFIELYVIDQYKKSKSYFIVFDTFTNPPIAIIDSATDLIGIIDVNETVHSTYFIDIDNDGYTLDFDPEIIDNGIIANVLDVGDFVTNLDDLIANGIIISDYYGDILLPLSSEGDGIFLRDIHVGTSSFSATIYDMDGDDIEYLWVVDDIEMGENPLLTGTGPHVVPLPAIQFLVARSHQIELRVFDGNIGFSYFIYFQVGDHMPDISIIS
ncbi:MAG: hypothetical protein KAS32_06780, partial [Candidatus Peribacteraceae bacterium]|nr:hypothetical protein [Candidatus Peribacteraceae bacterium]